MSLDKPMYDGLVVSRHTDLPLGDMAPGQHISKLLYVKCLEPGDRAIIAQVSSEPGDRAIIAQVSSEPEDRAIVAQVSSESGDRAFVAH